MHSLDTSEKAGLSKTGRRFRLKRRPETMYILQSVIIVAAFATLPTAFAYLAFPYGFEVAWLIVFICCRLFPGLLRKHWANVIGGLLAGAAVVASISLHLFSVGEQQAIEAASSWSLLVPLTNMRQFLIERSGISAVYLNTIICFGAPAFLPLFFWDYSRSENCETYPIKATVAYIRNYWIGFGALGLHMSMMKLNHMVYPFYRQTTPEQATAIQHKYAWLPNASFDSWAVVGLVTTATLCSIMLSGWVQLIESFLRRTPR
ncbi:UNVERIFIED_ORG: hypothetical protein M2438_005272 [Methylobacterium sp. SuP10 SLI 274]|uniref:hypothetical protein n=1 Tax=Methylorubrum extorquens TaxID=408 RepID=UPI00209FD650|nr:hypothetical protein [Methylorubrum extorquens]MDF9861144.1 hypothetical protein [Methylorubrum pseudosasae]MDH6640026.1 hypothetical protein [Methylobacterium sp. SuP10 SLI 274]MDH6669217.1 hypothetical protein [Methylorubrum zatmanii]MCP1556770.1 hypothetical protein [Methylorubrum extorquens]MDF9789360.1 hypothetical protein [Methylorubrum extorquens]